MEKRKEKLILIWICHFITSFKELEVGIDSDYLGQITLERKREEKPSIPDIDIWHLFG